MTGGLRTPSLRVRLVGVGLVTWVALVLTLDIFVFFSLRTQLLGSIEELVDARAALVEEIGTALAAEQMAARLTDLGIPATVTGADGRVFVTDVGVSNGEDALGAMPDDLIDPVMREVVFENGPTVTVFASRASVDRTLEQVLVFEAIGSAGVLLLMSILLVRLSRVLLDPIDQVVATAQHIAEGKTAERLRPDRPDTELGRMALAFDQMLDSLEGAVDTAQAAEREAREAEIRSRRFLADAAHQLRTPVAGLRALVDSLIRTEDPEARDDLVDHLAREAARTSRLISSLLRVAELDRGAPLSVARVDMVTLATDEIDRQRDFAPHLVFDHTTSAETVPVDVDSDAVREVLANLLDNARRHARRSVAVRTSVVGPIAEISVVDDGPGLPPDAHDTVFERFTTFDGRGGTGLGLAIARGIARAHDGDVVYRSGEFVLQIPLAARDVAAALPISQSSGAAQDHDSPE